MSWQKMPFVDGQHHLVKTNFVIQTRELVEAPNNNAMTWIKCPFVKGQKYRVEIQFSKFSQNFEEGVVLEFLEEAYSRYDNLTIFAFKEISTEKTISLEITDSEKIEEWFRHFEIQ
jgi:hypothetical protein